MASNTGSASYREGVVVESKPGFSRVKFYDIDGMVSTWLPIVFKKTFKDKEVFSLELGEQVACVMDDNFEGGVILGAIYSDADTPNTDNKNVYRFSFFDGGLFEYDRSSGALRITTTGETTVISAGKTVVKTPSVFIDAPKVECSGDVTVRGTLAFFGGMVGENSEGGTACLFKGSMSIDGNVSAVGDITATGVIMDGGGNSNNHQHP